MTPSLIAMTLRAAASQIEAQIAEAAKLRDLAERRADRIVELETLCGLRDEAPIAIEMSPTCRTILGVLLKSTGFRTLDALETALWGGLPEADQPTNARKCLMVHVHNLRRALKPYGVSVNTVQAAAGVGYFMTREAKARFAEVNAALTGGAANAA